jgi:tetratricopeptide (TPR) repeat protein
LTAARLAPGNALIEAGELAQERGEFLEASAAFEGALEDLDPLVVATAHNCLGNLMWQQGAYGASLAAFEKARAIAIRHDAADARARAEIGLGLVCYARGDYATARTLYEGVRSSVASQAIRGRAFHNLGIIANIEGDIASAEQQYLAACKAFAEAEDIVGQAHAYHNLGMLHADQLDWDQADNAYAKALEMANETDSRELVGVVTMNRSELSCAMGRFEEAIERCDVALAIFDEIGAEMLRGTTLRWKGRALRELGNYAAAERALTESMRIARRAQAKLPEAAAMGELAGMLVLSGDQVAARKWLTRSLDLFRTIGATREADKASAELKALGD